MPMYHNNYGYIAIEYSTTAKQICVGKPLYLDQHE